MNGWFDVSLRRGERQVLQNFTLEIPSKGAICLFGPSGCGKTTALHLLCGLLSPDAGRVTAPERIAMVFQEDRLLPWRDVLGNAALPPHVDVAAARSILEALGLGEELGKRASQLSGGQKRRVAIARALAAPADMLLLDEPFRGLDADARDTAAALIRQRIADIPCVLVAHDPREAEMLGARVVEMGEA